MKKMLLGLTFVLAGCGNQSVIVDTHGDRITELERRADLNDQLNVMQNALIESNNIAVNARIDALELNLTQLIINEQAAREAAVTNLQAGLAAEQAAREAGDNALADQIAAETAARQLRDNQLASALAASVAVQSIVNAAVQAQLALINSKFPTINNKLNSLQSQVNTANTSISGLQVEVNSLTLEVVSMNTEITALNTAIDNLSSAQGELLADIDDLEDRVSDLEDAIANLGSGGGVVTSLYTFTSSCTQIGSSGKYGKEGGGNKVYSTSNCTGPSDKLSDSKQVIFLNSTNMLTFDEDKKAVLVVFQ